MTIQDLRALGEPLGSVAVLATLVYRMLRTRHNTMAIGAQLGAAAIAAAPSIFLLGEEFAEGGYQPADAFVSGKSEKVLRGA